MRNLRASLIRLAYENPELRPHLLPLLKEASEYVYVKSRPETFRLSHHGVEDIEVLGKSANITAYGFDGAYVKIPLKIYLKDGTEVPSSFYLEVSSTGGDGLSIGYSVLGQAPEEAKPSLSKRAAKPGEPKKVMRLYLMDSKSGSPDENKKVLDAFGDLLRKNRRDFDLRSVEVEFSIGKPDFQKGHLGVDVDLSGSSEDIREAWESKDDIIYNVSTSINFDTLSKKTDLSPFGITEENFGLDIE